MTLVERFTVKVDRQDGCHEWKGARSGGGYGYMKVDGKVVTAHRIAWLIHKGSIPHNMEVCHSCDNPGCVNVQHLWVGTHADNMKDMAGKGRAKNQFSKEIVS